MKTNTTTESQGQTTALRCDVRQQLGRMTAGEWTREQLTPFTKPKIMSVEKISINHKLRALAVAIVRRISAFAWREELARAEALDGGRCAAAALFGVWVPVSERLPKTGRRVLVAAQNGKNIWRTVGEYWPAGTMDASNWDDPPEDWWDEDGNNCTNPESGWYESYIEAEMNHRLTGVTLWSPLLPLPSPNASDEPRRP